ITTTLRLHMWFVSQVHPASLMALRARVLRWVVLCESLLITALLATGIVLSGPHDATAAQFVVTSLLLLLSLIVIEPATTRASLSLDLRGTEGHGDKQTTETQRRRVIAV